jgi:eukaryotic-like serine/threonine-protein kinase
MATHLSERVRFGGLELNLRTGELISVEPGVADSAPKKVLLREQPFQILRLLLERRDKIVTRQELKKLLWPNDTVVDFDRSINVAIAILRKAVGDTAENPKFIETLPRRGYRLLVAVEWQDSTGEIPKVEDPQVLLSLPTNGGVTGKRISHYRVLEVLGGGGMGVVYRAEDLKLGRPVALKFLPAELAEHQGAIQRFEREAQMASALNHPNICTIYGIEQYEDKPFIVMELLEGESLSARLAQSQTPFALTTLLDIAVQVCSALQAAHAKDIIHRDVKPANIFLTKEGPVKILDFGLAKLASEGEPQVATAATTSLLPAHLEQPAPQQSSSENRANLTLTGIALGTVGYMSPEQIRKEKLDARTDLFSFGLVLYEMATGRRAFQGETAAIVHEAILHDNPSPAGTLGSSIPRRLNAIILKALEKDRARRYQTAKEMRDDLLLVQKDLRPVGSFSRKWLTIPAVLLVLLAAGVLYWRHHSRIALAPSDTLVRAYLDNQTGDAAFEEGMDFAMQVALEQTPYLNLLGRDKVHETAALLGLSKEAKITTQVALQACRKTNSRAIISTSIADVGNRFRVAMSAIDCRSGRIMAQESRDADARDDIVRALGMCAYQLRVDLGEPRDSLSRFNQPLEQATTSSPEALQFLALGYLKHLGGDPSSALGYYARAIEKDPNFGLAYAAESSANQWLGKPAPALADASKAFELRNRLTVPSRFQVETVYYSDGLHQWDKACPVDRQWVDTFPRDVIARINYSSCLERLGRVDERVIQTREAVRLLPSAPTLIHLLDSAIYAQRIDEARETYNDAVARGIDPVFMHLADARLAFLQNDKSALQNEWVWASQDPVAGRYVRFFESKVAGSYGRSREARRLAQVSADSAIKAGSLSDALFFESYDGLREAEIGHRQQGAALAADAMRKSQDPNLLMLGALILARAGDTKQSQQLAVKLNQLFPDDFMVQAFNLPAAKAAIKLNENNPAAAIEILRPVTPYDLAISYSFDNVYPAYLRGLAYLQLKEGNLAAAEFRKVLDHPGLVNGIVIGVLSTLQLARAQALMGDGNAARKSYEDFLTLWKDADPDLPIYKTAKTEYAALRQAGVQ